MSVQREFVAVSNTDRQKMIKLLSKGEMTGVELREFFPAMPQPMMSKHLAILVKANIVMVRKGMTQSKIYTLNSRSIQTMVTTLIDLDMPGMDRLRAAKKAARHG